MPNRHPTEDFDSILLRELRPRYCPTGLRLQLRRVAGLEDRAVHRARLVLVTFGIGMLATLIFISSCSSIRGPGCENCLRISPEVQKPAPRI